MIKSIKQNWNKNLEPLLKKAGAILLSYYNEPLQQKEKTDGGFVTPADIASEQFLVKELSQLFPEADIWSEEAGKTEKNNTSNYCWVIDPLDGTTNFAHGLPYFCISIALTYKQKPIVGAIYQPLTNEFFYAEDKKGAFLNGTPIQVSAPAQFNKAILAIGLPYRHDQQNSLIAQSHTIIAQAYAIRHYGAIALDLAYVACGRFDGLFLSHLKWWDVAAGILLIEMAGGIVTDFTGKPLNPDFKNAIGGGKMVHRHIANLLSL